MPKKKAKKPQRILNRNEIAGPAYAIDDKLYWNPIPKISHVPPWGYDYSESNEDLLIPDQEALRKLEVAKKLLKRYSLRQVALWLEQETGRPISHIALHQRIRNERERGRKASLLRTYANKAIDALRLAQKAEEAAALYKPAGRREGTGDGEGIIRRFHEDTGDYCPLCGKEHNLPTESGASD